MFANYYVVISQIKLICSQNKFLQILVQIFFKKHSNLAEIQTLRVYANTPKKFTFSEKKLRWTNVNIFISITLPKADFILKAACIRLQSARTMNKNKNTVKENRWFFFSNCFYHRKVTELGWIRIPFFSPCQCKYASHSTISINGKCEHIMSLAYVSNSVLCRPSCR